MDDNLPHPVRDAQPHSVRLHAYLSAMTAKSLRQVVSANVLALLRARTGELRPNETGITRLAKLGLSQGNAQRAIAGETSIGLDLLAELAEALEVTPWQLLIENLDPQHLPGLSADPTAWPFPMVSREDYYKLPAAERVWVQGAMSQAIADRRSSGKRRVA